LLKQRIVTPHYVVAMRCFKCCAALKLAYWSGYQIKSGSGALL